VPPADFGAAPHQGRAARARSGCADITRPPPSEKPPTRCLSLRGEEGRRLTNNDHRFNEKARLNERVAGMATHASVMPLTAGFRSPLSAWAVGTPIRTWLLVATSFG